MPARPDIHRRVECDLPYKEVGFWHRQGRIGNGAAYRSDRGISGSPQCSFAHRRGRGTPPERPAIGPLVTAATVQ